MNKKNKTAKIIQIIAIVNAVCGLVLGLIIAFADNPVNYYESIGFVGFIAVFIPAAIGSLILYGFGEIIELLQNIKDNTDPLNKSIDLPEL
ncbi:hypothetical protein [Emergencia timonensis]|uniref:hypothetical protein n=1 Tax=Emergencia timonensis TaxID=1776384 RepID=UPI003992508E